MLEQVAPWGISGRPLGVEPNLLLSVYVDTNLEPSSRGGWPIGDWAKREVSLDGYVAPIPHYNL